MDSKDLQEQSLETVIELRPDELAAIGGGAIEIGTTEMWKCPKCGFSFRIPTVLLEDFKENHKSSCKKRKLTPTPE